MKSSDTPNALAIGTILELKIEGIGSFGEGLSHHGKDEIFIPKTARGDIVRAKILEQKKGRYRAEVIEWIQKSESRVEPRCSHFETCGGCDFQHLPYEEQVAWKLRLSKHWIRRSPLAPHLEKIHFDTIVADQPYEYRHRVRMQIKHGQLHFFKPQSNELLALKECPILVDGFFQALKLKAAQLPDTKDWVQSYSHHQIVAEHGNYEIAGHELQFGGDCFTQGNFEINSKMWERIHRDIESLTYRRTALDLFSGIGNFSIPMTKLFEKVTGIESFSPSVRFAKRNSSSVEWIEEDAIDALKKLVSKKAYFDFVLLDPPRKGALDEVKWLAQLYCPVIVYISCNPETLIRDLTYLVNKARYKMEKWTMVDLFPQTHHIESIVTLRL